MANEKPDAVMDGIRAVFRSVIDPAPASIDESSDMENVPGWDSLNHVAIMTGIEKRFGVKLSLAELRRLESVRAIAALLRSRGF